ncbi:MAG: hypothetical protein AB7N91_01280 [Candidatus Tectimicrobiota bacterium]
MRGKRALMLLMFLALVGLCSCGGGDNEDTGATVNATGTYQGSWASAVVDNAGALTATFTQNGDRLVGQMVFGQSPCFVLGVFDADINGNRLDGELRLDSGDDAEITGEIVHNGGTINGTYRVDGGRCDTDRGSFSLVRLPPTS